MLARLAHVVARHRWQVIGAWIVLTLFGAFAAGQLSKRWYQSFSIPGKPAYEASQRTLQGVRHRHSAAERGRLPHHRRRDEERGDRGGDDQRAGADDAGLAARARTSRPHDLDVRVEGQAHDLREHLSAGRAEVRHEERRGRDARGGSEGAAGRDHGGGHRPRPARGGEHARQRRQLERPARGAGRRPRRARHPALRLRDAARRADADRRRGRRDPQHVHARLGADLHHERLDHRPVPDRARRPRRRDRLRAADDLPLPRRAARGRGRRDRARRDDDARRPLGDRLRLDGGGRPALDDHPAAAVHPLDRASAAC